MSPLIHYILAFWFDRPPTEWIVAPAGLDEQIKSEFGALVISARNNELEEWTSGPHSSLALIVLLEQFPRNIYRGSPEAFTSDAQALDIAIRAIAQGFDKEVTPLQASAFYMPLIQQESLVSLIAVRLLFEGLLARCETEQDTKWAEIGVAAANRHVQQMLKFGRYPTRNAALGRENTKEEEEFLKEYKPTL
ncbi:hypothetical protein FB567DRAFT_544130 [Paraphoma chrysanthemicola]|uniref:DUF924-domain-containing protein n=1 Tax=Paraphoma chrysanthemicola TaxID=798071 RepID=A0A8K0RJB3_9PLEO|nr:hypothetical protein FB567DRAFT_544130 [Paraphoma chrysanthemicola]